MIIQELNMILNKYQAISPFDNRGYSLTGRVQDASEQTYFAKWIKGINKNSQASRLFFDKLRHLKRAEHPTLPKIIEYGWDEVMDAYCIIFEYKNAETLEVIGYNIPPSYFFKGIEQLIGCLQLLNNKHRIAHGDITPANVLVDKNFDFYLIDFGLADITATLSQAQNLEIFAKQFAAPEKWDRKTLKGFPFQADIFSLGKVIEWYLQQKDLQEFDELKNLLDLACHALPAHRLNYNSFSEGISKIVEQGLFDNENTVAIRAADLEIIEELNNKDNYPIFDVLPDKGNNILVNIATTKYKIHCLWLFGDKQLKIINYKHKNEDEKSYERTKKYGQKLGLPVVFKENTYGEPFDLTPYFRKIQYRKKEHKTYRDQQRHIIKRLDFYKKLLQKELDVLEKNSLRLYYVSFEKQGNYDIHFKIDDNEKFSSNDFIEKHIRDANPPNEQEFEYIVSSTTNKKQLKNPLRFSGIVYDFNFRNEERILKFKDCDYLDFYKIPKSGYILQDIRKEEEEKKRQLEAIRKVEFDEAQSRSLINALFFPQQLKGHYIANYSLTQIFQENNGVAFEYSPNQKKAIIQALERKPLTVIQGPPGTGKTTVITEIVFQILHKEPNATILITSQTNDAVDNVLDNLLKNDIPIVRLSGIRPPKKSLQKHTMERKIEGWKKEVRSKAIENWKSIEKQFKAEIQNESSFVNYVIEKILGKKSWKVKKVHLQKIINKFNVKQLAVDSLKSEATFIEVLAQLTTADIQAFFQKKQIHEDWLATISGLDEKSHFNQKLVKSIRVIGATTNHIAAGKYKKYAFEFDYVIMDESGKATLAESLVPLTLGNKAVLVGDHRQLRPMLTSTKEVEKWLRKNFNEDNQDFDSFDDYFNRPSLFEEIITRIDDDFKSQLESCRRCSADQVRLISECFYEPFGDEKIEYVSRSQDKEHNLDLKVDSSIIFLDIGNAPKTNSKKRGERGSSYNLVSAKLIPQILQGLDQFEQVQKYDIGIITGYTEQLNTIRNEIKNTFRRNKLKNINFRSKQVAISVVDRFQGLEKDVVIFDLVRSQQGTLGFLDNANRINVALSRQKKLLIIIGNYDWLVSAKSSKMKGKIALQQYLKKLKRDWIVKSVEQIF